MHWHAGCSGATGHDQTVHSVHDFCGGVCGDVRLGLIGSRARRGGVMMLYTVATVSDDSAPPRLVT